MENYGHKLQKILAASGWSQDKLSDKLDVSFPTLNSWVNGKSEPREDAKKRIDALAADILGSDAVDPAALSDLKTKAGKKHYSVKKLLIDRDILDEITVGFTYHSNGTEGSTMTEGDVSAVLLENKTLKNRTNIEQREAVNHRAALFFLLDALMAKGKEFKFTPELIQATHLRLMNGIISDAGLWRNHAVRIRGASVPLANFIKIPELMENWSNLANGETQDKIGLLASTHAAFEKIHPFSDGNGRTGRILLFVLALKLELVPPILPKDRRVAYYKYLELAQTRDILDPLELYIAENILETAAKIMD